MLFENNALIHNHKHKHYYTESIHKISGTVIIIIKKKIIMLLLFLRVATAESSCDFITSTCLLGCIFETQTI